MSLQEQVLKEITKLVQLVIADRNLELVDVEYRRESRGYVLRIIIYKEDGLTVDDCAGVSREVGHLLEVEDIIEHGYNLEVSSPGLTRSLKTKRDFERNIGAGVKLTCRREEGGVETCTGLISEIRDNFLCLENDLELLHIPMEKIIKGKLVIEF